MFIWMYLHTHDPNHGVKDEWMEGGVDGWMERRVDEGELHSGFIRTLHSNNKINPRLQIIVFIFFESLSYLIGVTTAQLW